MIVLIAQLLILSAFCVAIAVQLRRMPYPSPLIRPLLPGKRRWPEAEIRGWLRDGDFHPGYLRFFYRDPERIAPDGDGVLAPADGLITSCDERDGIRYIVVALTFWDMHVQRSPVAGRVVSVKSLGETHTDGEGREFAFLREKLCPVQTRIELDSAIGPVAVRLITSVAARRIETWVHPEMRLTRGQRIGRILLGSTVVLEVPAHFECAVPVGLHVRAGETVIFTPAAP